MSVKLDNFYINKLEESLAVQEFNFHKSVLIITVGYFFRERVDNVIQTLIKNGCQNFARYITRGKLFFYLHTVYGLIRTICSCGTPLAFSVLALGMKDCGN